MNTASDIREAAEKRKWSAGVLTRYWLLQLPEAALVVAIMLLLQHWLAFSSSVTWGIVALWVAKDAALYPLVWRSYDPGYPITQHTLDGEHGVATERLDRSGYVRVRGELWYAELSRDARPVDKDEPVQIQSRRGLTVIVTAVSSVHIASDHSEKS